ncbi:MAG: hypothetical protein M1354_01725 [Candidatus Marsarchaeota archaeon]|jgi:predicted DNA-binding protein|nr:hypothetical protein [Candidatus Marsarchaeota archaeon]
MKSSMEVVSFRIPRRLKEKMDRLDTNWSDEVRKLIEIKVRNYRRKAAIEDVIASVEKFPGAKAGTAAKYIREGRDSN